MEMMRLTDEADADARNSNRRQPPDRDGHQRARRAAAYLRIAEAGSDARTPTGRKSAAGDVGSVNALACRCSLRLPPDRMIG